jgi:hypothetical protein
MTFVPVSESQHRLGKAGHDVPDYCRNCHRPFMAHNNGECPKADSEIDRQGIIDAMFRSQF